MSNPRVLCLGEILFDCLADQVGRSLEESNLGTVSRRAQQMACALIKLGTSSGFIVAAWMGMGGERWYSCCNSSVWMQVGYSPHSSTRSECTFQSGDRIFAGFRPRHHRICRYTPASVSVAGSRYLKQFLLGYTELAIPTAARISYCPLAEQYDVKVLDVNWRPVFWLLAPLVKLFKLFKQIDFLKLSEEKQNGCLKPLIRERLLIASTQ